MYPAASGFKRTTIKELSFSTFLPLVKMSYLGLPPIPPDLKSIAPYLQRAHETRSQDQIISYWCMSQAIPTVVVFPQSQHALIRRCMLRGPDWHLAQGRQRNEPCIPRSSPHRAREPPIDSRLDRCHHRRERVFRIRGELCLESFRFRG